MGFLELLLIGIIALIVLGPERLPKAARTVGLWIGKAKQGFNSIQTEIDRELKVKELQIEIERQAELIKNESEIATVSEEIEASINHMHDETNKIKQSLETSVTQQKIKAENTEIISNTKPKL